jgi:hypothetical protein
MASLIQIGIASTHSNNAKRNCRYPIMDSMLSNGRIFRLALALIYMSLICCASHGDVKVKHASERELLTDKKSIFLFRLSIDIDGKPMDMYQEFNQNRIHISISNIDTEGSIEHLATVYSPSTEMSKNGWFYLLLDPAAYYMKISLLWQPKINPVLFFIPSDSRLVYGGSFLFSCNGGLAKGFQCTDIQISNETSEAELIASRGLNEQLPISAFIAEIITDSLPDSGRMGLMPIGILTSVNYAFNAPSWRKSVWSRTTGVGDWWTILGDATAFHGQAGAWALTAYIFYLPMSLPFATVMGEASQYSGNSCMQRHMDELAETDLKKEIATSIQREFEIAVMEGQNDELLNIPLPRKFKSFLEVDILHIGLKECKPKGTFSPEVSFRTKLWDVATKKVVYNKIFIYTHYSHSSDFEKPYYYFLPPSPICRRMSSYCDDETRTIFKTEIANSIQALSHVLKQEIGPPVK